jgi:hypothetical protein
LYDEGAIMADRAPREHTPFLLSVLSTQHSALLFILLILTALLTGVSVSLAQEAAPPISAALTKQLTGIEQLTSDLRGLAPLNPLDRQFPTRKEAAAYIARTLDTQLRPDDVVRETLFYRAFNLLPAGTDLRKVYQDLLSSPAGVAGFYDTETKKMNVVLYAGDKVGDALPMLEQVIYAHEFTHALQDQHFDLDTIIEGITAPTNPDRSIAATTLFEGDAMLVMTGYLQSAVQKNPLAAVGMLVQGAGAGAFNIPPGTPSFLVTELTFPYETGLSFVSALFRAGGWERVNQAYKQLPESTEHILHPEKYLAGEKPIEVTLKTPDAVLGKDWLLKVDRPLGEFYLLSHLRTHLPGEVARKAAAGWGGDRYHIYAKADGDQIAWVLKLAWDTPDDAKEFEAAYQQFAAKQFKDAPPQDGCWSDSQTALCITADGGLVAAAPTVDLARKLLATQG